ncbi:MAG: S1C family serine protease [Candidatus Coproplasma sp.]
MRKFIVCAFLAATLSLTALCGCSLSDKSIASIEKTSSVGLIDYYTITYTDGTTSTFTVTNGRDGTNGQDAPALTVDDVYEFYKQTDPDMTKEEFVEKFLSIENGGTSQDNLTALSSLFRSGLIIYTAFNESSSSSYESYYMGSGVIYRIDTDYSYILTNYHMVYDEYDVSEDKITQKIFAYMYGSEYGPVRNDSGVLEATDNYALNCEYVGGSVECDVAILKVPTAILTAKYPYVQAVTVNCEYEVGQTVYALGNPDGLGLSLTKGIVSVDMEAVTLDIAGQRRYYLLRTDADLDHGSSGGGLFNSDGELVALCNAGSDSVTSINYAIPASTVTPCAEGILYYNGLNGDEHCTYRMRLGVTVYEDNCRYEYDAKTNSGRIVADICVTEPEVGESNPVEGYPAYIMGLQAGDVIKAISINGVKYEITRMYQMSNVLMRIREGDSVTITVKRGDYEIESSAFTVAQTDLVEI